MLSLGSRSGAPNQRWFASEALEHEPPVRQKKEATKRRRQALRRRRQRKKVKELEERAASLQLAPSLDFDALAHSLLSKYSVSKMKALTTKLQHLLDDEDTGVAVSLLSWLQAGGSGNLEKFVLSFLLNLESLTGVESTAAHTMDHTGLWLTARMRALENNLHWSSQDRSFVSSLPRTESQRISDEKQRAIKLGNVLEDTQELDRFLRQRLPPKTYQALVQLFENYTAPEMKDDLQGVSKPGYGMRTLSNALFHAAPTHYHLISDVLVDFFLVRVGLDNLDWKDENHDASKAAFEQARHTFVDTLEQLYERLLEERSVYGENAPHSERDAIAALVAPVTTAIPSTEKPKEVKLDRRYKRLVHARFLSEKLVVVEDDELEQDEEPIVFLDNLPIDVTADELDGLYSRIGPIESIEVFNQRPDLDPGPLNTVQLKRRRKEQATRVSTHYRKWQRPKGPVYGTIRFQNKEDYEKATSDALRIFGKIIRLHPVRSIRSRDMKNLYIENLHGLALANLKQSLSQELCLKDLSVRLRAGQNPRVPVGSCEIRFRRFADANLAYQHLLDSELLQLVESNEDKREEEGDEPAESAQNSVLHWMRTPKNAEKWWTRQIGFD